MIEAALILAAMGGSAEPAGATAMATQACGRRMAQLAASYSLVDLTSHVVGDMQILSQAVTSSVWQLPSTTSERWHPASPRGDQLRGQSVWPCRGPRRAGEEAVIKTGRRQRAGAYALRPRRAGCPKFRRPCKRPHFRRFSTPVAAVLFGRHGGRGKAGWAASRPGLTLRFGERAAACGMARMYETAGSARERQTGL